MMNEINGVGRERMRGRDASLLVLLVLGTALLWYSASTGVMIGSEWLGNNASFQWHMNNYIVIEAKYAYAYFGLAALAIGGLATGLATPAFFSHSKSIKRRVASICSFFGAIILTGLGFNTLDFMLGSFYWTNMQYPPPVAVPVFGSIDVWNFYFFFFVVPLWLGGFMMGLATSSLAFVYYPHHLVVSYVIKRNLTKFKSRNLYAKPKEWVAKSSALSGKRKTMKSSIKSGN